MAQLVEPVDDDSESVDIGDSSSSGVWCDTHSARAVIRTAIASSSERLTEHLPGARIGTDPEMVHQARVATRRLRSDLRTFASLLDTDWTDSVRAELSWLADRLGAVRDADVLGIVVATALSDSDTEPMAHSAILDLLARQRHEAQLELCAAIDATRTAELLDRLREAALDPPTAPHALGRAERRLRPLVRKPWRHLTKNVAALDKNPSVAELHRVRLLAKRARYAAEAAVPTFGGDAQRLADALGGIQDVLGDMHDAENAAHWLEGVAPELDTATAFAAGRTTEQLLRLADAHRTGWERSFKRANRRSHWLR